jgi:CheY-like chemotaxis protein
MARSILLVEDDADIRMALRDLLAADGFVVHTARDGQHALRVLERIELPSLIVLDYKMPVMNGSQFLAAKRRNARLRDIPVVLLSAWTREWSGRLEVAEMLGKPVDPELLLTTVRAICGDHVRERIEATD